jgi:transcriptional regulator with XRE-family HTH domain
MTGDNIKRIRIEQKLTQKKLGELCGIDEANLRKYENGRLKPSLNTIRKIASSLNVYLSDLIDDWSSYSSEEYAKDLENGLPLDELGMLQDYRILNDNGKNEARKRVNELTEIKKYTE